jgi:hypothetical protein
MLSLIGKIFEPTCMLNFLTNIGSPFFVTCKQIKYLINFFCKFYFRAMMVPVTLKNVKTLKEKLALKLINNTVLRLQKISK